ncbi:MAG: heavy metal translocating P-type ATPase [Blastocatellales bacterium]|nr:cation-translocating P-type ATPase [Nitrosomonas nitrosa]
MEKLTLDLELLLPEVADEQDQCVARLQEHLKTARGVTEAHLEKMAGKAQLCIHYDAAQTTLAAIQRLATQTGAEISDRYQHNLIRIEGMDCSDCTLAIEHGLKRMDGVLTATVNYAAQTARVEYDTEKLNRNAIEKRIRGMGYAVAKEGVAAFFAERRELIFALLAGAFVLAGWLAGRFFGASEWVTTPLYLAAYLFGGWDIARHAVHSLREKQFDTDLLMVLAALGAGALGEFFEGGLLLFLFSLGHALEEMALDRARDAVRKLGDLAPKTALVLRDGKENEVSVEQLIVDDTVIVRPGVRIPVDGAILSGASAVNQAPVTGESVPVEKAVGDKVFAGTINGDGALEVKVTRLAKDNTLARVMQMVEEAQTQKTRTQQMTEKFTRWFVPAVLIGVALMIVVPPLLGGTFRDSFLRAMTLLVACSPCALALGTPSAMLAGIAQAARKGLLIKGGAHLETLGALTTIAFDKTGTLTHGQPEVTDVVTADANRNADEFLAMAAAVESRSGHPLAQAVVRAASNRSLTLPLTGELTSFTGRGIRSTVNGADVLIGNRKLFDEFSVAIPATLRAQMESLEADGKTTMIVGIGGAAAGVIALADTPRADAKATLQRLKQLGIRQTLLLTGDNRRVGEKMASLLGLDAVRAELMPEDKVTAIRELAAGETVAMVGDGVNDAPALAAASVGIAMGGAGTDVALETADVALMGDELSKLPFAIGLGRATRAIVFQNLAISALVIAFLIVTSILGVVGIGLAIIFHEGSTLVVVANSLRLLAYRE